jgi:hypothetical protein
VIPEGYKIVVFEQGGDELLSNFAHPQDGVYVFGRSRLNLLLEPISYDHAVKIETLEDVSLFGCEAAAIALFHRKENSAGDSPL